MPFINQTDKRTVFQEAIPDQNIFCPRIWGDIYCIIRADY